MGVIYRLFVFIFLVCGSSAYAMDPPADFNGAPDSSPNAADPVNSGRFITITRGLSSLGDTPNQTINLSIRVPNDGTQSDVEILIFDGDIGGTWDVAGPDTMNFELFPDPNLVANTAGAPLATMAVGLLDDNAWSELFAPVALSNDALSPDGQFFYYHLVGTWEDPAAIIDQNNLFKIATNGEVFLLAGSSIGFIGYGPLDPTVPPTAYDGRITFNVLIPDEGSAQDVCSITIYDGDADRDDDDDDANSPSFPPFQTSPITIAQGVRPGDPADDGAVFNPLTISPSVSFRINGPASSPIVVPGPADPPLNVSGDKEWEKTTIYSTDPLCQIAFPVPADADITVPELVAGESYEVEVFGLDGRNTIFFNVDKEISFNNTETCPVGDLGFESKSDGSLFASGDIVTNQIPGITVSTENAAGLPAMIFDSFVPTGGDDDLGSPSENCVTTFAGPGIGADGAPSNCFGPEGDLPSFLGKVLIISEDGFTADDKGDGGTIVFEFDVETDIDTVSLLDIEETGGLLEAFDSTGDFLASTAIPATGDNSFQTVPFIVFGAKTLKVTLAGSGAITGVTFCPECIPQEEGEEGEEGEFCPVPPDDEEEEDLQGCTPGYWKQPHHFGSWVNYQVGDIFRSVFNKGSNTRSLHTTLGLNGGGKRSHDRHAVAALLNAANPDVNYFMDTQEVIDTVFATYVLVNNSPKANRKAIWNAAKDVFEQQNELGCPL